MKNNIKKFTKPFFSMAHWVWERELTIYAENKPVDKNSYLISKIKPCSIVMLLSNINLCPLLLNFLLSQ